jgi:hypothetical protein
MSNTKINNSKNKTTAVTKKSSKSISAKNGNPIMSVISMIETALVTKDIPAEKMTAMFDLFEKAKASYARDEFFRAISMFQGLCPEIPKDGQVKYKPKDKPTVEYNHSTLPTIMTYIKGPLERCGLSVRWRSETKEKTINVICRVSHELGHFEEVILNGPFDETGSKNSIQSIGSTRTYLMRYTLEMALGIITNDFDDDGKSSEDEFDSPITEEQRQSIFQILVKVKRVYPEAEKNLCKKYQIEHIFGLGMSQYSNVMRDLKEICKKKDIKI